jgi:glycosyltransferase involved in cell wall biosynthesis
VRNSDKLGGPERLLLDQFAVCSEDVRMTLSVFAKEDEPNIVLDEAAIRGFATHRIKQTHSFDPRVPGRLRQALEEGQPSLLVSHDYKADVVVRRVARQLGLPRVAIVHGYTRENLKVRLLERWSRRALRDVDAAVVVSDALALQLLRAGVPPARLHQIPNAINADAVAAAATAGGPGVRAEFDLPAEEPVFLALGRLSPEKGQDLLLDAFALWQRQPDAPQARLLLVGDGALRPALETRIHGDKLLRSRVHLAGWREDPHAFLGAADALVLPSRSEGLPLALLEAMAVGLPVAATRVGQMPKVLEEGRYGTLVDPDDVEGLAQALPELLGAAAQEAAHEAAAQVRAHYSTEEQALALEDLYRDVVGGA